MTLVVLAAATRLRFGVDLTDEAYYATFPHRFLNGDTPFVSDLNVRQNAGLLTLPLAWSWKVLTGGTDGLILVLRVGYFVARLALTALAIRVLWNRVPHHLALLTAAIIPAFVLFSIPSLSYNTIPAMAMSSALCFLLLWGETGRSGFAVGSAISAALAAFAHPALFPVAVITGGAIAALPGDSRQRKAGWTSVLTVGIGGAALAAGIAFALGSDALRRLIDATALFAGPGASVERLAALPVRLLELSGGGIVQVALWGALWFIPRFTLGLRIAIVGAYCALTILADVNLSMAWLALASLPLVLRSDLRKDRAVLACVILSLATGLTSALFSTNGAVNLAVGSEPAVLLFFLASWKWLEAPSNRPSIPATGLLVMLLVTRALVWQWRDVYRDDAIPALKATIPDGPYKWMRTTPEKATYVAAVQRELRRSAPAHRSLLVMNRFPGAQLMADLAPAVPHTWVAGPDRPYLVAIRIRLAEELAMAPSPVLVLQVNRLPETRQTADRWTYPNDDPLVAAVHRMGRQPIIRTADFELFSAGVGGSGAREP